MTPLRILLIDDHTLFRSGLAELLERRDLQVVGTTGDGREGVELATEVGPDIVLLDLRMPKGDGVGVLHELKRTHADLPVVMLTTRVEDRDLIRCLRGGAQGYLLKDMEPDRLIDSLHEVMVGTTVVAPAMTGVLARLVQGDAVPPPAHGLPSSPLARSRSSVTLPRVRATRQLPETSESPMGR